MVGCIGVKWSPVELSRAEVEYSRVKESQGESSRTVVDCSRVK